MPIMSIKSPNAVNTNKSNHGYRNIFTKAVESAKPNKEDTKARMAWSRINHKYQKDKDGKWRRKESMDKTKEIQSLLKNAQTYKRLLSASRSLGKGTLSTLSGRNIEKAKHNLADVGSKLEPFKTAPKGVTAIKPSLIDKARTLVDAKERPGKITPNFQRELFGLLGEFKARPTAFKTKNIETGGTNTVFDTLLPPMSGPLKQQYKQFLIENDLSKKYEQYLRNSTLNASGETGLALPGQSMKGVLNLKQFTDQELPFSKFVEQKYNQIIKEQYKARLKLLWERIKRYGLVGAGGGVVGLGASRTDK